MNPKSLRYGFVALLSLLAACTKKTDTVAGETPADAGAPTSVALVKSSEQSRHFAAVSKQLELGGTVYGYMDIDGDVKKFSGNIQGIMRQMAKTQPMLQPVADKNFEEIFQLLGFEDIKALGVSSVPEGDGFFRNRAFFYTPQGRHGLMAGFGGKAGPFARLNLAPADTDFYGETEIDLPVLYRTVKDVVAKVAGDPASKQMDTALEKAGEAAAFSFLDLIDGLKGHAAVVVRFDPQKNMQLPVPGTPVVIPAFSMLVSVDGVGQVLEPVLAKSPLFTMTQVGTQQIYAAKQPSGIPGFEPVLVLDGSRFYLATTREFLAECLAQKSGLADTAEFKTALAQVGSEGNGLVYINPRCFARLRQIETLNPSLPEDTKATMHFVMANLPSPALPLITVRTNLPDGILVRSHWDRSLKQDIVMLAVYNPVTVGFMAAMAIPAFQKVRGASQQKTIMNNLRMFAAAGDQFCLETGMGRAGYNNLVGPDKYIKVLIPVAGEDYRRLVYVPGQALRVRLPSGQVIEYKP